MEEARRMLDTYESLNNKFVRAAERRRRPIDAISSIKLEHNTYCSRRVEDGVAVYRVTYHKTVIITAKPTVVVFTPGDWVTMTTLGRLRNYVKDSVAILGYEGIQIAMLKPYGYWPKTADIPYDTPVLHGDITLTMDSSGDVSLEGTTRFRGALNLKRMIQRFCKAYIERLCEGKLAPPGAGDCFFCQMGGEHSDTGHLINHITSEYYVPTIMRNALQYSYGFPLSAYAPGVRALISLWPEMFGMEPPQSGVRKAIPPASGRHTDRGELLKILRRYMLGKLMKGYLISGTTRNRRTSWGVGF